MNEVKPLSSEQVINTLWKLTVGYKALIVQTDFLTNQVLTLGMSELHDRGKARARHQVYKRITMLEESLEGLLTHYPSTLKEKETNVDKKRKSYKSNRYNKYTP